MLQIFPALWSIFIRWGGRLGDNFSASLADYCRSVWLWHKHVGMVGALQVGSASNIWHMVTFTNSGQQGKITNKYLEKNLLFCFLLLTFDFLFRDRCWEYGMSGIVWKLQRVHFCLPFTQKLELVRARKHTKVNLMSKWVFHVMLDGGLHSALAWGVLKIFRIQNHLISNISIFNEQKILIVKPNTTFNNKRKI